MVFGENLSVRIRAQTGSFTRGVSDARDALSKFSGSAFATSGSLQVVQESVDETEDEIGKLERSVKGLRNSLLTLTGSAASASASFAALSTTSTGLSASLTSLATSTITVIGVVGVLTGAVTGLLSTLLPLAAVVGTLTAGTLALAGAFSAVIGSGILAFGRQRGEQAKERLEDVRNQIDALEKLEDTQGSLSDANERQLDQLEDLETKLEDQTGIAGGLEAAVGDLRDEIAPLIADFGEKFLPLIEDAVDALPTLVENILAALGSLTEFKEAIRAFGEAVFDAIPNAVVVMRELAEDVLPLATRLVRRLGNNALPVFNAMLRVTDRLRPAFFDLGRAFVDAVPNLTRLGTAILNTVLPALEDYLRLVDDIIQLGRESDGFVDFVRKGMDRLVAWVQGPGLNMLGTVATTILNGLNQILAGETGSQFFIGLTDLFATVLQRVSDWFDSGGQAKLTSLLTNLFGTIATVLTNQRERFKEDIFTPLANIIASLFTSLTTALNSEEAGQMGTALGELAAAIGDTFADALIDYVGSDAFVEDLQALGSALTNSVTKAVTGGLSDTVEADEGDSPLKTAAFGGPVGLANLFKEEGMQAVDQISPTEGGTRQRVEVVVDEDTDLTEARIRESSRDVIIQRERRAKRQTGGTTSP